MVDHTSRLAQALDTTSRKMLLELEEIRGRYSHAKTKGDSGEEIVREFLRDRLPKSVGVTSGQVIDATGTLSREIDVIIYDAMHSPMLFSGERAGSVLVPAEAVIAVVEVKFRLRRSELASIRENCRSVKTLQRTAYIKPRWAAGAWEPSPIHYSVFAFESDSLYAERLTELQAEDSAELRVDLVTALDRGVGMYFAMDWDQQRPIYSARAIPEGAFGEVADQGRALMFWFGMLTAVIAEVEIRPLRTDAYLAGDLQVEAKLPASQSQLLKDQGAEAMARRHGMSPDILKRLMRSEPLSIPDIVQALESGLHVSLPDDADPGSKLSLAIARQMAKVQPSSPEGENE